MTLPALALSPDANQFSASEGAQTLSVQLSGGAPRFRRDKIGATYSVTVQWSVSAFNFNYLKAFYRTTIANGSLPFTCYLPIDSATVSSYTCRFKPQTFKLASKTGNTYVVTAELDVTPNDPDPTADAAIVVAGPEA